MPKVWQRAGKTAMQRLSESPVNALIGLWLQTLKGNPVFNRFLETNVSTQTYDRQVSTF
jgi:hypothetical protein